MKAHEIRHIVGDKIFDAYWPERLYNHDAENMANMVVIGTPTTARRSSSTAAPSRATSSST